MQTVIFPKMSGEAAEAVTDAYLDSRDCRDHLEKLLTDQINAYEFLCLLKNDVSTKFDDFCDQLKVERYENIHSGGHDEHEDCEVPA